MQQIEVRDKDNTLAFPPYYEWLALNEAAREPGKERRRAPRITGFSTSSPFSHASLPVISLLFYDFACIVLVLRDGGVEGGQ